MNQFDDSQPSLETPLYPKCSHKSPQFLLVSVNTNSSLMYSEINLTESTLCSECGGGLVNLPSTMGLGQDAPCNALEDIFWKKEIS